jgi:hypothetical protein
MLKNLILFSRKSTDTMSIGLRNTLDKYLDNVLKQPIVWERDDNTNSRFTSKLDSGFKATLHPDFDNGAGTFVFVTDPTEKSSVYHRFYWANYWLSNWSIACVNKKVIHNEKNNCKPPRETL